jgi:ABC-type sugar transport system ATPase subunit
MSTGTDDVLRLHGVTKVYPGVRALDRLSIEFRAGEIHGVVGQNGAGKSTLMQMIAGNIQPDEGEIEVPGAEKTFTSPAEARQAGISIVSQEFQSLAGLTVTENVLLGSGFGGSSIIRWSTAHRAAAETLESLGLQIDVRATMESLSPAHRKLVEIARAVHENARLVVLDEPTAALEAQESAQVLAAMTRMRAAGRSVVFVSHRLDEILACCDRLTVLRDGRSLGCWPATEHTAGTIAELMVGQVLGQQTYRRTTEPGEVMLEVDDLAVGRTLHGLSFQVRRGEVVGLSGVLGSGRSEVGTALFGISRAHRGQIMVDGKDVRLHSPSDAVKAGIAYVPSDRQRDGIVFTMDLEQNLSLAALGAISKCAVINRGTEAELAERQFAAMRVVARGLRQYPMTLSGGNQQKILLGRWLALHPKILVLDDPTQGIDVGAKAEIHTLIRQLVEEGLSVVLISSDVNELTTLCDRAGVIRRGQIARWFDRSDISEHALVLSAEGASA